MSRRTTTERSSITAISGTAVFEPIDQVLLPQLAAGDK